MRVKFNELGQQKLFLNYVKQKNKMSFRKISKIQNLSYELLKKHHQEKCLISKEVFIKLCKISGINPRKIDVVYLDEYWGQSKGGKS